MFTEVHFVQVLGGCFESYETGDRIHILGSRFKSYETGDSGCTSFLYNLYTTLSLSKEFLWLFGMCNRLFAGLAPNQNIRIVRIDHGDTAVVQSV